MTPSQLPPSRFAQFVAELKRRHIVRFALGYAAAAFVVLQLAEIIFPAFQIGETGLRILVVAVALLFPPALVLAWIFDVSASGIERTEPSPLRRGRLLPGLALFGLTVAIVGSVGIWLDREGVLDRPQTEQRRRSSQSAEPTLVAYDPGEPIRSLAVLPLDDFTGGDETDYFTLGMQEELIAQLSQLAGLRVVSRTSVQRYAGGETPIPRIGRDLQVDAVIEGSVRRSDNQIRITVQLIHAASDTHVWTQQYDRSLENLLALQSEVALDIARQIEAELTPEETSVLQSVATRSVDPDAQDAYLRGRFEVRKGTPEALAEAQQYFLTAVEEDSTFAPALAGLAGTRFLLGVADSALSASELARAQQEAQRALYLDSASLEAREVLTLIQQVAPMPPAPPATTPGAAEVTRELPRSMPGRATVVSVDTESADSSWFQAMTQFGRLIESRIRTSSGEGSRDPSMARFIGARQLMAAGLFDEAAGLLEDLVREGVTSSMPWELLARADLADGEPGNAVEAMEDWSEAGGDHAPSAAEVRRLAEAVDERGAPAFWAWTLDRLDARIAAGERVAPSERAAALAGVGDTEGAFQALEQALSQHDRGLVTLQKDPVWDVLRGDPRFTDVARRSRLLHMEPRRSSPGGPR